MELGSLLLMGFLLWLGWALLRSKPGKRMVCTACGHYGPTRTETKGSLVIEIILWLAFIAPGLIYSVWWHSSRTQVSLRLRSQEPCSPWQSHWPEAAL